MTNLAVGLLDIYDWLLGQPEHIFETCSHVESVLPFMVRNGWVRVVEATLKVYLLAHRYFFFHLSISGCNRFSNDLCDLEDGSPLTKWLMDPSRKPLSLWTIWLEKLTLALNHYSMWFDSTATALSWMIFGHHLSWVMSLLLFDKSWPSHSECFFETGVFPKNWRVKRTSGVDFGPEAIFPVNLLVSCCWHSWMAKASRCPLDVTG